MSYLNPSEEKTLHKSAKALDIEYSKPVRSTPEDMKRRVETKESNVDIVTRWRQMPEGAEKRKLQVQLYSSNLIHEI